MDTVDHDRTSVPVRGSAAIGAHRSTADTTSLLVPPTICLWAALRLHHLRTLDAHHWAPTGDHIDPRRIGGNPGLTLSTRVASWATAFPGGPYPPVTRVSDRSTRSSMQVSATVRVA